MPSTAAGKVDRMRVGSGWPQADGAAGAEDRRWWSTKGDRAASYQRRPRRRYRKRLSVRVEKSERRRRERRERGSARRYVREI